MILEAKRHAGCPVAFQDRDIDEIGSIDQNVSDLDSRRRRRNTRRIVPDDVCRRVGAGVSRFFIACIVKVAHA